MIKAQSRAERKFKAEKTKRNAARSHPYGQASTSRAHTSSAPGGPPGFHGPRPGRCFNCGGKGHWRRECPEEQKTQNKISAFCHSDLFDDSSQRIAGSHSGVTKSPVGRLRSCLHEWENIKANEHVLRIVKEGYRLPLKSIPCCKEMQNNRSARDNELFVSGELENLLSKGCISKVSDKPHVVNPLTVAYNKADKPRLVLDCRHVNPHLYQFKFKYEDSSVARQMFDKGDQLFSYDLKSAYHHIMIHQDDRTYLGLHWDGTYYVFNVLPFGIATAGFIFSKVMREVVKHWRENQMRVIMYLDDGLGGASTLTEATQVSSRVKSDLIRLGFLIAEDKCHWEPCQSLVWLGLVWDMKEGKLKVTQDRIEKMMKNMDSLFYFLKRRPSRLISVKHLASVVGQLISTQAVLGNEVRLRTRYAYECILARASWNAMVMVSESAEKEIKFWRENIDTMNAKGSLLSQLTGSEASDAKLFCDTSGEGYGGYVTLDDCDQGEFKMFGSWNSIEADQSSTWRELEAVNRVVKSSTRFIENKRTDLYTDNKNVETILKIGSKKPVLHDISMEIKDVCLTHNIELNPKWIPRGQNVKADKLSRVSDCDDWGVQSWVFDLLEKIWGPHTFDRFASYYNRKSENFNSKFWRKGTKGIDAFQQIWKGENNWLVPPVTMISSVSKKIKNEKCNCTLIIPEWKSAPFWPLLFSDKGCRISLQARKFSKV